jgi:hypothetical protein
MLGVVSDEILLLLALLFGFLRVLECFDFCFAINIVLGLTKGYLLILRVQIGGALALHRTTVIVLSLQIHRL